MTALSSRPGRSRSCSRAAACSRPCSARTPLPRKPPTGLRRLRRHVAQRRLWVALLLGAAVVEACAQSGSLAARALGDQRRHRAGLGARARACHRSLRRRLAPGLGSVRLRHPRHGRTSARSSCSGCGASCSTISRRCRQRYFSEQRAGWIIARLTSDVDAISDVLSTGPAHARVQLRAAARRGGGAVHQRLAAGARLADRAAAGDRASRAGSSAGRPPPSSRSATASPR